jgi:hypothetical protein
LTRIFRVCVLVGVGCLFITHVATSLDCPPCFFNQKQPKVQGQGLQDGRPIVTVQIKTSGEGSWNVDNSGNPQSSTNAAIWNGVQGCEGCVPPDGAIGAWNSARGTASAPPPYYFKLDQNTSTPNITVIRDPNVTACGKLTGPNGGPYTLHLPPSTSNLDIWSIVETVAHELGHTVGLFNSNDVANCYSIMGGASGSCSSSGLTVTEKDVNQSIRAMNPSASTGCEVNADRYLNQCDGQMANNCAANGGSWDPETCTCLAGPGCDQTQSSGCLNNGGTWNSDICTCENPQYYYGGGGGYYCQYECYDYYTAVSTDGENWEYEYKGRECYQTGCYYYY